MVQHPDPGWAEIFSVLKFFNLKIGLRVGFKGGKGGLGPGTF
jgi:hypothetical protein